MDSIPLTLQSKTAKQEIFYINVERKIMRFCCMKAQYKPDRKSHRRLRLVSLCSVAREGQHDRSNEPSVSITLYPSFF